MRAAVQKPSSGRYPGPALQIFGKELGRRGRSGRDSATEQLVPGSRRAGETRTGQSGLPRQKIQSRTEETLRRAKRMEGRAVQERRALSCARQGRGNPTNGLRPPHSGSIAFAPRTPARSCDRMTVSRRPGGNRGSRRARRRISFAWISLADERRRLRALELCENPGRGPGNRFFLAGC